MSLTRGVVASASVLPVLVLASGCGAGSVEIDSAALSAEDAAACSELVDSLPDTLLGELRRPVAPDDAPGAAWGDPPAVLTCGVGVPAEYDEFSACIDVGGVGWFVPPEQLEDLDGVAVATVLTHSPRIELEVPGELRSAGVDSALAELAPRIRKHLAEAEPCH